MSTGERIGQTVGYTIRLESKTSRDTRLLFCTTGILLKRLEDDETLENVSHVFVDEVRESLDGEKQARVSERAFKIIVRVVGTQKIRGGQVSEVNQISEVKLFIGSNEAQNMV